MIKKIKRFSSEWSRSQHMKDLHAQGRYDGVSKIGLWNVSEEKRARMLALKEKNRLDKTSHGYGSEYHMRLRNRELLHNKFQGQDGYFYFLDFPKTIKLGFSKDWERRTTKQILGGKVIMIISGPTNDLADLEFNSMIKFQDYTQLDQTGTRYTEFLDKKIRSQAYNYLVQEVKKNPKLKFEIKNL